MKIWSALDLHTNPNWFFPTSVPLWKSSVQNSCKILTRARRYFSLGSTLHRFLSYGALHISKIQSESGLKLSFLEAETCRSPAFTRHFRGSQIFTDFLTWSATGDISNFLRWILETVLCDISMNHDSYTLKFWNEENNNYFHYRGKKTAIWWCRRLYKFSCPDLSR